LLTALYILFFIACIILIVSVLLQPGKSDAGALFTTSVSSTAFGPRGTASILSKITIGAATIFMLVALLVSLPALTGNVSVLQGATEESSTEAPATDANANANSATNVDANAANANAASAANTNAAPAANTNAAPAAANANAANTAASAPVDKEDK
jgi:preprotein translocase subunit SecG